MGVLSDIAGAGSGGGGITGKVESFMKKRKAKRAGGGGSSADASSGNPARGGDDSMMPEFKRGGKVKRTGIAKVHRGEEVLTASQARKYRRGSKKR